MRQFVEAAFASPVSSFRDGVLSKFWPSRYPTRSPAPDQMGTVAGICDEPRNR
jgi:hypothetical protein